MSSFDSSAWMFLHMKHRFWKRCVEFFVTILSVLMCCTVCKPCRSCKLTEDKNPSHLFEMGSLEGTHNSALSSGFHNGFAFISKWVVNLWFILSFHILDGKSPFWALRKVHSEKLFAGSLVAINGFIDKSWREDDQILVKLFLEVLMGRDVAGFHRKHAISINLQLTSLLIKDFITWQAEDHYAR